MSKQNKEKEPELSHKEKVLALVRSFDSKDFIFAYIDKEDGGGSVSMGGSSDKIAYLEKCISIHTTRSLTKDRV